MPVDTHPPGVELGPPPNDPHKQDAMKMVIPPFKQSGSNANRTALTVDGDTIVPSDTRNTLWPVNRTIRIDQEAMNVLSRVRDQAWTLIGIKVSRAQYGTVAAAHAPNAAIPGLLVQPRA